MTSTAFTVQDGAASSRQWRRKNLVHKATEQLDLGTSVGAATKLVEENITTMDSSWLRASGGAGDMMWCRKKRKEGMRAMKSAMVNLLFKRINLYHDWPCHKPWSQPNCHSHSTPIGVLANMRENDVRRDYMREKNVDESDLDIDTQFDIIIKNLILIGKVSISERRRANKWSSFYN